MKSSPIKRSLSHFILFCVFGLGSLIPLKAEARLDISPIFLNMEARERSKEVVVFNTSNQNQLIEVVLMNYEQNEDGTYKKLDAPLNPDFDPATAVRYSPRQFTLPANGRQIIRISVRRPADLPDGSYRFHLMAKQSAQSEGPVINETGQTNLDVGVQVGFAIPVVVEAGSTSYNAEIQNARLIVNKGRQGIELTTTRTGNGSALLKAVAFWKPAGGEEKNIGQFPNYNIFSESDKRTSVIYLNEFPQGPGQLRVALIDNTTDQEIGSYVIQP